LRKQRSKIKILFLIDELLAGGTEKQLVLLADGLPQDRFNPVIGVLKEGTAYNILKPKSPLVNFHCSGMPIFRNISLIHKIRTYLQKECFDILQTQFPESEIYGGIAAKLCRHQPILISTRRNLYHWIKEMPWHFRFGQRIVRWSKYVLVNSKKASLECQKIERIPPEKILWIPNAIEADNFSSSFSDKERYPYKPKPDSISIGVVANWRPIKGLTSFLKAAALISVEIPNACFVLVGHGLQENELKLLTHKLGINNRVTFINNCKDVSSILATLDIAVQPSLSESFSNVLLEYMAAAMPIVATRVGDAEIIIENNKEGLLVSANKPQDLAAAVISLCHDREKALRMGKLAQQKVKSNWSQQKILDEYIRFYESLFR